MPYKIPYLFNKFGIHFCKENCICEQDFYSQSELDALKSWIKDKYRKPSEIAFTEGEIRNIAFMIEQELNDVVK